MTMNGWNVSRLPPSGTLADPVFYACGGNLSHQARCRGKSAWHGRSSVGQRGSPDGSGNRSVQGDAGKRAHSCADETATGTWTVNPDCTGTLQVNLYESGQLVRTSVTSIVFDDNSKEFRMVQKSLALPNGTEVPVIITLEGRKQ